MSTRRAILPLLLASALLAAAPVRAEPPAACEAPVVHRDDPDGTLPHHRDLATWLSAWPAEELDRVILDADAISGLNLRNQQDPAAFQDVLERREPGAVAAELHERLAWLGQRLADGTYVSPVPGAFVQAEGIALSARHADTLHIVAAPADLRCVPMATGLYKPPIDEAFDRNRCSALHAGELVRVGRVSTDGRWRYVHAGHSVGWIADAALTPALDHEVAARFRDGGERLVIVDDYVPTEGGLALRMGTSLPRLGDAGDGWHHVLVPGEDGLRDDFIADTPAVHVGHLPLTRRRVLEVLLPRVGDAYGWGGAGGGRDCSRLLLDAFAAFGLRLGRHSGVQAAAGADVVDVAGLDDGATHRAIREAASRGVVFLYMPGHIMLYLGDLNGKPHALSALGEYLVPCPGGADQVVRVDRVDVTTLELGRGTERTAFIERLMRLAVFGSPADAAWGAAPETVTAP